VLTKDAMKDVARVAGELLSQIICSGDAAPEGKRKKKRDTELLDDDEDDDRDREEEDESPTPQAVRFALADVMCSLMRANTEEFLVDVMPTIMQLVSKLIGDSASDADRALGFYIADCVVDFLGDRSVAYWQVFMNHALVAVLHKSPSVQQYASKVVGTAARQKQYSVMALAACQNVFQVLQKHGEKHKRRRAKASQKSGALAIDACVRALGLICEHQEATLGTHAPQIWSMWLSSLPIKYEVESGRQVHAQLLGLLGREHPAVVDQSKLPTVLKVLVDVYKTKFSEPELDKKIAFAMAQIGQEKLEVLCSDFKDGQKKKTEQMLKNAAKTAAGA